MTQEKFNIASKIQEEINRLNMLIKYIQDRDEKGSADTIELAFNMTSDFLYLVHLLGADDVLSFIRTRKRMLYKEYNNYDTRRI